MPAVKLPVPPLPPANSVVPTDAPPLTVVAPAPLVLFVAAFAPELPPEAPTAVAPPWTTRVYSPWTVADVPPAPTSIVSELSAPFVIVPRA